MFVGVDGSNAPVSRFYTTIVTIVKTTIGQLRRIIREALLSEVDLDPSNNPGRPADAKAYIGMTPPSGAASATASDVMPVDLGESDPAAHGTTQKSSAPGQKETSPSTAKTAPGVSKGPEKPSKPTTDKQNASQAKKESHKR